MLSVTKDTLPAASLLRAYQQRGHYTDCYQAEVDRAVFLAEYIRAFYTTPLFRMERAILARAVSKPSTDGEADELAQGSAESFAAWHVEARDTNQLLMCDFRGQTRSWLMIEATATRTRLFFGSAVMLTETTKDAGSRMPLAYVALLPFHKLYSRALLSSARRKLVSSAAP
ncbi:MAG: hypothetical protein AAF417_13455 [Pseudomonadota bacterium]